MADEIRPVGVPRARRVRSLSREDREENEERFQKKLAELTGAGEEEEQGSEPEPHRDSGDPAEGPAGEPDAHRGRHLDVET